MMTKLMQTWADEVKRNAKKMVRNIIKDTIVLCAIKIVEDYLIKKPIKMIIAICRKNEWNEEEHIPSFD